MISLESPTRLISDTAKRVRDRRLERGWSQKELAARSGLKLPTYVQFERTGNIAFLRLVKILLILGDAKAIQALGAEEDFSMRTLDEVLSPKRQRGRRFKERGSEKR